MGRGALALAMLVTACGSIPEGRFVCTTDEQCPPGWTCRDDRRCWARPSVDAGPIQDASSDAGFDAGCPMTAEACNGIDDDCDGNVDEGLGLVAEVPCNDVDDDCDGYLDEPNALMGSDDCGCEWFEALGRHYRLCMLEAARTFDQVECGNAMQLAVVSSPTEASFLAGVIDPFIIDSRNGFFIGLRQGPGASTTPANWQWVDGVGMPIDREQFDDVDLTVLETVRIENGDQDCGCFGGSPTRTMIDCRCAGDPYVLGFLCEDRAEETCVDGTPCLLAQGCPGQLSCALPRADRCRPSPASETCNDWDDDCNGVVDDTNGVLGRACGCTPYMDPATSRRYAVCTGPAVYSNAACGPGYRLAVIDTPAENAFVSDIVDVTGWTGLHQPADESSPGAGWIWHTGVMPSATYWETPQPNDGADSVENGDENCMATNNQAKWFDVVCGAAMGYVCEEI